MFAPSRRSSALSWTPNIWMEVSIESQRYADRARLLSQVSAQVRFLSIEPMLGPIENLPLAGIHWVLVGGESGRDARPHERSLVTDVFRQCRAASVPFFFKQWGGVQEHVTARSIFGRHSNEMPRVQHTI